MKKTMHLTDTKENIAKPSEKSTGLVFAAVSVIIGLYNYGNPIILGTSLAVCTGFTLISLFASYWLKGLNNAWFRLSLLMSAIVQPVVMMILFLLVITPLGLLARIWYDPLVKRQNAGDKSYWLKLDNKREKEFLSSMKDQF